MKEITKAYCPYCKKELEYGEIQCGSCGTTYGLETLLLVKKSVKEMLQGLDNEQRKYDRIPKKLRVTYKTNETLRKCYLAKISRGGVFVPTRSPLRKREKIDLQIFLPDEKDPLTVFCEVAWSRKETKVTPTGKYPPGMGLKFLSLSQEGKAKIDRIIHQPSA